MPFLFVVGARPNFVKIAPVLARMRERVPDDRHVLVHTGQHYDPAMSDVFIEELGMPSPDHFLSVGSGTHAVQTARIMERIEPVLQAERPELVIVPGDVNSTLAVTLVAVKKGISVAHVEAGLRSFDRSMPEEINRIVVDEFSDPLLIHSEEARTNLCAEGIADERIHFVGNTMIDTLVTLEARFRNRETASRFGLTKGDYLLVTLHRPALVDDSQRLVEVLEQLALVARTLPVIFPVHPRTRARIDALKADHTIRLVEPLGYLDFLSLEADAAAVLTDSGGIQEETTYLGVPCFTLRDNTERPVTVRAGTNVVLGLSATRIADILPALASGAQRDTPSPPPGWDGRAAERVADVICSRQWRSPSAVIRAT